MPTPRLPRLRTIVRLVGLLAVLLLHPTAQVAVPVIPPGQEALLFELLGGREVLTGGCRLAGAQVDRNVVRARYACGRDRSAAFALELRHPHTRDGRFWTRAFAVFVVGTSEPPPGFLPELSARMVAHEGSWRWTMGQRRRANPWPHAGRAMRGAGAVGFVLLLLALWLRLGRGERAAPATAAEVAAPAPSLPPVAWIVVACMVAVAVAWRLVLSARYPFDVLELLAVRRSFDREFVPFLPAHHRFFNILHAPLHPALLCLWLKVGSALGCTPGRLYLRALNLPFAALSIALTARIGALLRAPAAGVAAAAIVAFAPAFLLLSIEQGNYLYEMVGTLWFVERWLGYVAWRRPVLRSLAVAAALSIWSGYMTALVIGPGLVLVAVVAARRREPRLALYAVLLFAALVAPLVPTAFEAYRGYLSLSVRAAPSLALTTAIWRQTDHRLLPLNASFMGGSFRRVLVALPESLLGAAGHLVAFGAALLLWRRRWRALLPLGLIALFAAVGTRVTLVHHNYAAVWPIVVLVLTVGADGLPLSSGWPAAFGGATGARRFTVALQGLLVACCLLLAHRRLPIMRAASEGTSAELLRWWDTRPIEAALARAPADMPVMVYRLDYHTHVVNLLCTGASSTEEWVHCAPRELGMGPVTRVGGWLCGRTIRRETAWRPDAPAAADPRAEAGQVFRRDAWRARGWLVIRGTSSPPPSSLDAYIDRRCVVGARVRNLVVLRCPPDDAAGGP